MHFEQAVDPIYYKQTDDRFIFPLAGRFAFRVKGFRRGREDPCLVPGGGGGHPTSKALRLETNDEVNRRSSCGFGQRIPNPSGR